MQIYALFLERESLGRGGQGRYSVGFFDASGSHTLNPPKAVFFREGNSRVEKLWDPGPYEVGEHLFTFGKKRFNFYFTNKKFSYKVVESVFLKQLHRKTEGRSANYVLAWHQDYIRASISHECQSVLGRCLIVPPVGLRHPWSTKFLFCRRTYILRGQEKRIPSTKIPCK